MQRYAEGKSREQVFNGIRSSRKLERECTRNIELMCSSPADQVQLFNMAEETVKELKIELNKNKEEINVEELTDEDFKLVVLADKGYYVYEDFKDCLESGIKPIVPKQKSPNMTGNEKYITDNFIYDKEKDIYVCPEGDDSRPLVYSTVTDLARFLGLSISQPFNRAA